MSSKNSDELLSLIKLDPTEIINLYQYGSRVYGTFHEKSDWDYTVIVKGNSYKQKNTLKYQNFDINFYGEKEFEKEISNFSAKALEYLFLPSKFVPIQNVDYAKEFKKDGKKIANSFINSSKDSWTSAETHWNLNKYNKSKKKIFHTIRTLLFGIQILKKDKIYDYEEGNTYYKEIMKDKFKTFEEVKQKYYKVVKNLMAELEKLSKNK
eukprot:gene4703-8287_t